MQRTAGHFRLRGLEMTRIETFTDAAFAFALTLLVISLEPPSDMAGFTAALGQVPAFLLSAVMLMMFWWAHHEWSRRYGLDDARTFLLSCMLVFTVLVYVYPLRFMFGAMMAWLGGMAGLPLGSGVELTGPRDVATIFLVYGVGFTAMSSSILLLNLHAWQQRNELALDTAERHETRTVIGVWTILAATGAISTTTAWLLPGLIGAPGWVHATLPLTTTLFGMRRNRELKRLLARSAAQRHPGPGDALPPGEICQSRTQAT